jgi:RNA polymerase sigma factor (sigma-70 family)
LPILNFCKSRINNKSNAEDVCQNVLLILSQKAKEYNPNKSFYAWAFRICHFQMLAYFSKSKRNLEDSSECISIKSVVFSDPSKILIELEAERRKKELINNLTKLLPPQQQKWWKHSMSGKNKSEIKQIMKITEFNYNSLRSRTIKKFRELVQEEYIA